VKLNHYTIRFPRPFPSVFADQELEFIECLGMRLPLTQLGQEIAIHLLENTMYVTQASKESPSVSKLFTHFANLTLKYTFIRYHAWHRFAHAQE